MNPGEQPEQEAAPAVAAESPGRLLREAREERQLTQQAVADALHLRQQVVDDIEYDRYDKLPPATFVKGYIRSYAKLVGVPEERATAAFEAQGVAEPEREVAPPSPRRNRRDGAGWRWVGWLVLAALVVLFVLWWRSDEGQRFLAGEPDPAPAATVVAEPEPVVPEAEPEVAAPQPAPELMELEPPQNAAGPEAAPELAEEPVPGLAVEPEPEVAEESVPEPTQEPSAPEAPAQQLAAPEAAPAAGPEPAAEPAAQQQAPAVAAPEPQPQAAASPILTLRVLGTSWMEVRNGRDERVLVGNVQGPEVYRFDGPAPFSLIIGNADAVEVEYGGEPVELAPHTRGRVARLQLPADA